MLKLSVSTKPFILNFLAASLIGLFFYAAFSQLLNFEDTRRSMLNQVFPAFIAHILAYLIPLLELIVTALMIFVSTRWIGFYASAFMLLLFSVYILITMTGVFGRIPCSCGGLLKSQSYWAQLLMNILFLFLAIIGISLEHKILFFRKEGIKTI